MKRNELRNLGLTPEQIDAVMTMNGNDVNREKAKSAAQTGNEVQRLRESCVTLLDLLESPEAVQRVLLCVSRLYNDQERRKARKEYPGGVLKTTTPQNDPPGDAGMKVTISFTPEERDQAWKVREVLLQLLGRCRTHTSQIGERCMIYLTLVH